MSSPAARFRGLLAQVRSLPRLLRNILANYAGAGISATVIVLLTPFVIHRLGDAAYGIWVLVHSLVSYLHFFDLGMYSALVKYAAEAPETEEGDRELQRLLGTTLVMFLVAGGAALAASGLLALFVAPLLDVPDEWLGTLQLVTVALGFDLVFVFVSSALRGLLEGRQRYEILNAIDIMHRLGRAVGTVALLLAGQGLVSLIALEIAGTLVQLAVLVVLVRRLYPRLSLTFGLFDRPTWSRVRGYSFWALLNDLATQGGGQLDVLLIPVFLSISLLTPYSVACSISMVLFWVIGPVVEVLFPLSSELGARDDRQQLDRLLVQASRAALAVAAPIAILIWFTGEAIVSNWVGEEYVTEAVPVLMLLVPSFLVTAGFAPGISILTGLSRVREVFLLTVAEIALAATLVVLSIDRLGLVGLAGSMLVANVVLSFGGVLPLVCRTVRVPVARYLWEALGRALLPCLPTLAAALGITLYAPPATWLGVAGVGISILAVHAASFWLLGTSKAERAEITHYASRIFPLGAG